MLAHIVLITWGYAAGDAAPRRRRRCGTSSPSTTPACCSPRPAPSAWSWSSVTSIKAARRGCATSRGTCCTSTPTSASASPCRTSCGPARSSSPRPAAPSSGGRLWAPAAGAVLVWRVGAARCGAAPGTGCGSPRSCREAAGVVSVYVTGRRPGPAAGRGRPVLHLAVPRPAAAGPARNPYSLSAAPDGRSLRITVKDARRRQRRAARACGPGTRVLVEGPYGRLSARARTRPQGRPDRRRRRHHPAAGAGRGARLRAGRGRPAAPVHRPSRCSRASSTVLAARARPAGAVPARPPARRRTPGSGTGVGAGRRPDRAALLGPRHRRARRLRLRPRAVGRRASAAPTGPPASRPTTSTSRPSAGDPMRRIVLWS